MTLDEFKLNIKYKLGYPVVNIELSTDQFNLAVEEAITYYQRNHYDGSEQLYMPVQITNTIKTNKYVEMPDSVIGVNGIFDIQSSGSGSLFSIDFIMTADAAWQAMRSGSGMAGFYNMMSYRSLIQQTFTGKVPVRFNYNRGRVYIDMSPEKFVVGDWIIFDVVDAVDPEVDERMFDDPFLNAYTTACVKKMWAQTLKKYQQVQLPGGIMLDGQTMYSEALDELNKMEDEMTSKYQLPMNFAVG